METKELLKEYQNLLKKCLAGWRRTLYEWKKTIILGILFNILFFLLGLLIGAQLR